MMDTYSYILFYVFECLYLRADRMRGRPAMFSHFCRFDFPLISFVHCPRVPRLTDVYHRSRSRPEATVCRAFPGALMRSVTSRGCTRFHSNETVAALRCLARLRLIPATCYLIKRTLLLRVECRTTVCRHLMSDITILGRTNSDCSRGWKTSAAFGS